MHLLCRPCCFKLLETRFHSIPCCQCQQEHELNVLSFNPPPPLLVKILEQLVVTCDREQCKKAVHMKDLCAHLESKCVLHCTDVVQSITVDQILHQPVNTPPTQIEMETAGHVVRKILSQSSMPFSLPSAGGKSVSACKEPQINNHHCGFFCFVHTSQSH